jgi:hypothetical protein
MNEIHLVIIGLVIGMVVGVFAVVAIDMLDSNTDRN